MSCQDFLMTTWEREVESERKKKPQITRQCTFWQWDIIFFSKHTIWVRQVQRVLTLCEFHYCNFSKRSITLPYANLCLVLWATYYISAVFWLFLANANFGYWDFFSRIKSRIRQEHSVVVSCKHFPKLTKKYWCR